MKLKVLVIGRSDEKRQALLGMLACDGVAAAFDVRSGPPALDRVESVEPDAALILLGEGESDSFAICERIYLSRPRCAVVMVADEVDTGNLQKAMDAGAMSLIRWPESPKELQDAVFAASGRVSQHLGALNERRRGGAVSRVITVLGTKGGIGKTTIAVNLAVKLSQMGRKVALVDLDLQFGDVGVFLDIDPKDTIAELVRDNATLDADSIRNYMALHGSGVHALCAPSSPEYADIVTGGHIERIVNALKGYYDYVILDTPPMLNECVLTAVEASGLVLFVLGMDISILRNARICLNVLDTLGQKDKVAMVVNREVEGSVAMKDVQKIVGMPIFASLPSDWKLAVAALNRGVPFVLSAPNSGLSRAFLGFVKKLTNEK